MDELEISGKRYISSRRAGKQYHYHSDYIGQLVRGGKVVGTKVGRAWYVDEASLAAYLGKEAPAPIVKAVAPIEVPVQAPTPAPAPVVSPAPAAQAPIEEKLTIVPQRPVEEIIVSVSRGDAWEEKNKIEVIDASEYRIPIQKKGLTYIEDNEPLLPEIRSNITRMPVRFAEPIAPLHAASRAHDREMKKAPLPILSMLALFVAGIAILSAVAVGSSFVMSRVVVEQGKPASVGFSLDR